MENPGDASKVPLLPLARPKRKEPSRSDCGNFAVGPRCIVNRNPEDWRTIDTVYGQTKHAFYSAGDGEGVFDFLWALASFSVQDASINKANFIRY